MLRLVYLILCLAFAFPVFATLDMTVWQGDITAGKQASGAGKVEEARQHFTDALALAEKDDPKSAQTAEVLTCLGLLAFYQGIDLTGNDWNQTVALQLKGARNWEIAEALLRPRYATYGDHQLFAAYRAQADFYIAEENFQRALKIRQDTLPGDNPARLSATASLGAVLAMQGKPYAAQDLLRKALDAAPPDTALAATLKTNLAAVEVGFMHDPPQVYAYSRMDTQHTSTAETLLQEAQATREKLFSPQSAQALYTQVQIGNLHSWTNYSSAIQDYSAALDTAKVLYPPDDHDTLAVVDALAQAYREVSGKSSEEVGLYTKLDAEIFAVCGDRQERRLPALMRLAWHNSIYGTPEQARASLQQVLTLAETAYGVDSLQVADALDLLDWNLYSNDKADYAVWEKRALDICTKAWGADSAALAEYQFARVSLIEDRTAGEAEYQRLRAILEKAYGTNSPEMVGVIGWLHNDDPSAYWKLKQQKELIDVMGAVYGEDHPALVPLLDNLGRQEWNWQYSPEGEAAARRALAIQEAAFGPNSPEICAALRTLQDYCFLCSKDSEREQLLLRGLAIEEGVYGTGDFRELSSWLEDLIECYGCEGKLAEEEAVLRRLLGPQRPEPGDDPVDFSYRKSDLADVLKAEKKYAQAEPYYLQVVAADEKKYGQNAFALNFSLRPLAELYEAWGKPELAQPVWEHSHAISLLDPDFANDVMDQLIANYLELKQPDKADAAFTKEYAILQQRKPDKPEWFAWTQMEWAEWNVKAGRFEQARSHFQQVETLMPKDKAQDSYFQIRLALGYGDAAMGLKDYTGAEAEYRKAVLAGVDSTDEYDRGQNAIALDKLAAALRALGHPDAATAEESKAKAIRDALPKPTPPTMPAIRMRMVS